MNERETGRKGEDVRSRGSEGGNGKNPGDGAGGSREEAHKYSLVFVCYIF